MQKRKSDAAMMESRITQLRKKAPGSKEEDEAKMLLLIRRNLRRLWTFLEEGTREP